MDKVLENELFGAFANASDNIFIYVCDMKTNISRWSEKTVEYFGLEGEYIEDAGTMWLEHIHPDDRQVYLDDINAVFSGKSANHSCQYRARNKYGDYVWVECKGSVRLDEEGNPAVFAGIMTRLDSQIKYDNLTHLKTMYELQNRDFPTFVGSMMLIGVNGFRIINSRHGFIYGNHLLLKLAQIIEEQVDNRCEVFRLQSDEFVVLGSEVTTDEMVHIFNEIEDKCNRISLAEDGINSFTVSAGVVRFPEDGKDYNTLISNLAHSIAYAKEDRTSNIAIFSKEISDSHNRKSMIAEALTESIKNDYRGFELYFQPIVDNNNSRVVSCEALLRWNSGSEEIGACYPGEFIPILEGNGSIVKVGFFVMQSAIRQAAKWQKIYKDLKVSFNVSYLQMEDPTFIPSMIETAKECDADPSRIIVELTESVLVSDKIMVNESFNLLREHGFMIALDDFGTGNSSFSLLHDINIDIIKLDQSFIRGLSDTGDELDYAIVESIALLCNRVNYMTVAEGIETEKLWYSIREFGFTGLQGYLFSRPIPLKEFEDFLEKNAVKVDNVEVNEN